MTTEAVLTDRAKRLPDWRRVLLYESGGPRHLTAYEVCLLYEVFEDAKERWLHGGPIEDLGVALGVLKESK